MDEDHRPHICIRHLQLLRRLRFLSFLFDDFPPPPPFFRQQAEFVHVPRPPYTNNRYRVPAIKPPKISDQIQSTKRNLSDYTTQQGEYWAILGHQAFEAKDYQKAIEHYNRAIQITDSVSQFFRSRGLAYKKIGNLELAYKDAVRAVELNDKNIKALLLCGQVMAEKAKTDNNISEIEAAIKRISKGVQLCAGQKKEYYQEELGKYIYKAKKLLWYKTQEIQKQIKLEAIANYQASLQQKEDLTNEQKDVELKKFIDAIGDPNEEYKFEIPSYLLCKLSKELMEEPVATEAGEVYEKQLIVNHFKASINQIPPQPIRDPTTKQEVRPIVHTVHNIKQATQEFLLQNPWAFEYQAGENYKDIQF